VAKETLQVSAKLDKKQQDIGLYFAVIIPPCWIEGILLEFCYKTQKVNLLPFKNTIVLAAYDKSTFF